MADAIRVEIAYAEPSRQFLRALALPAGSTIADAIAATESDDEFERRTTGEIEFEPVAAFDLPTSGTEGIAQSGPLEAIAIYERLLREYPNYERRDQVLYQMARAYDELGRTEEAIEVMQRLVGEFGYSRYSDEVQFRRGEYYFFDHWDRYQSKGLLLFARWTAQRYSLVAVNTSDADATVPFWFPIGGSYREELHGGALDLAAVVPLQETQLQVPSNYGRVWTTV